jgi:tetratricopeptide (TPR) repeat protein
MQDPARSLYEALRVLEHRAGAARRNAGLSASRRQVAATASGRPYNTQVDARRISSWLPEDPGLAQVPRAGDAGKVWALVRVWSDWAGDQAPQQRYWMDLIEAAQPSRIRKVGEDISIRSAYLRQVGRIAPPALVGREAELAELAAFCVEPGCAPYVWWQAGAWAGKSALLSTFVLHPPPQVAERSRILSFFVTARLASQDTREAFTHVLLEQLAELTGQQLPAVLREATREAYLLDLLAQAAAECRNAGGRLVLVVDGLDEDRGVTSGPHAHSIAALLPADPPDGMRVIVAGRPNPPVPDDVPQWHPLCDPRIIRPLQVSPHARDVQRLSRQELQRLLHGSPVEQDLLGLLTAARGGLSSADIEELTGAPLGEIEEILRTVAGRTFASRASSTGPEVYLLGHDELHTAAIRYFSHHLDGYRDRLHCWADEYRVRGWPPETPDYLLSGYYRLLVMLGDLPRMITCAGDAARHNRMLNVTGGDAAALAEIRTALDFIAAQDTPDLASALCLACYRDLLTDRNASIPIGLPAVWAALGQVTRAEALATSIPDPGRQVEALAQVVETLTEAGAYQQAAAAARQAERLARSITDPDGQVFALVRIARTRAGTGAHQQAATVARSIPDPGQQMRALALVAETMAVIGLADQAEQVARSITDPGWQTVALVRIAGTLAEAGQHERDARSTTDPGREAEALAQNAQALAKAGQHEQAAAAAGQAEQAARSITSPYQQAEALVRVAGALGEAGAYQQAEAVARSITDSRWQAEALVRVAGALAEAGAYQQAEAVARSITDSFWQAEALIGVAEILAGMGAAGQAEQVAHSITERDLQAGALARVAGALAKAGEHERAAAAAGQAEQVARSITSLYRQAKALAETAEALAKAGEHERATAAARQAEQIARSITERDLQAGALMQVAGALTEAGAYQQAEAVARSITDPESEAIALAKIAAALTEAGAYQQAEAVARSITDPSWVVSTLTQVAETLAEAGQHERAAAAIGQAEAVARSITSYQQAEVLGWVAQTLAWIGSPRQAETLARSITEPYWQARTLAQVAGALARAGSHQQAEQVACSITRPDQRAEALARAAEALAEAGQHERAAAAAGHAEQVACSITSPDQRAEALARVAEALAEAGQHKRAAAAAGHAEQVARSATSPASALTRVAEALARIGEPGHADAVARLITDPQRQPYALARVAETLAEVRAYQQAEQVARSITVQYWQTKALAQIAETLAGDGAYQQAEMIFRSITDPDLQAETLARVAETLAGAGDPHYACRVAAAACAAGQWTISTKPVLLLDPSAFAAVARVLEDMWRVQLPR